MLLNSIFNSKFIKHNCYKDKVCKEILLHLILISKDNTVTFNLNDLAYDLYYDLNTITLSIKKMSDYNFITFKYLDEFIIQINFIDNISDEFVYYGDIVFEQDNIYEAIKKLYNSICLDLPAVNILTDKRKKSIDKLINTFSLEDFKTVFINIDNNDFYCGRSKNSWSNCNFDWIINYNNFIKMFEMNSNRTLYVDNNDFLLDDLP